MPKYIDADKLVDDLQKYHRSRKNYGKSYETISREIYSIISKQSYADVEPKQKWISVNPDKPKEDGKYFVLRHSQGRPIVEIMYYGIPEYLKDRHFYFYDSEWGDVVVGDVTHWLPLSALPELPKEEYDGTCRTE